MKRLAELTADLRLELNSDAAVLLGAILQGLAKAGQKQWRLDHASKTLDEHVRSAMTILEASRAEK